VKVGDEEEEASWCENTGGEKAFAKCLGIGADEREFAVRTQTAEVEHLVERNCG